MSKKILFAGESWMSYTTHVKGFDSFYTSTYSEGVEFVERAIRAAGYDFEFIPNHLAAEKFPYTAQELARYACVVLSDIGSNTLLLPPATFGKSEIKANRCQSIRQYVHEGGAFLMIGGYMSFAGIDAKARYGATAIQDILPVKCLDRDDREEHCQGIVPAVVAAHPALAGLPPTWPRLLGYNKTIPLHDSEVPVTINGDPLVAFGKYGKGMSAVFTSDCAPHWGPPAFVAWSHYDQLWKGILDYITAG
jgi:uncharacterized membrane protein